MPKQIELKDPDTGAEEMVTAYFLNETVKFEVQHSKDYKGERYLKDGTILTLHCTTAGALQKKGVGKIVKDK